MNEVVHILSARDYDWHENLAAFSSRGRAMAMMSIGNTISMTLEVGRLRRKVSEYAARGMDTKAMEQEMEARRIEKLGHPWYEVSYEVTELAVI